MKNILIMTAALTMVSGCSEDPVDACVSDFVKIAQKKQGTGACKGLDKTALDAKSN